MMLLFCHEYQTKVDCTRLTGVMTVVLLCGSLMVSGGLPLVAADEDQDLERRYTAIEKGLAAEKAKLFDVVRSDRRQLERAFAALTIAASFALDVKERREIVRYLKKVRFQMQNEDAERVAFIALAHLDDPEAVLHFVQLAQVEAEAPEAGPIFFGLRIDFGRSYVKQRGGNAYLVSCLRSHDVRLRKAAWTLLKLDTTLPDVKFEPQLNPKEQEHLILLLEEWAYKAPVKEER